MLSSHCNHVERYKSRGRGECEHRPVGELSSLMLCMPFFATPHADTQKTHQAPKSPACVCVYARYRPMSTFFLWRAGEPPLLRDKSQ